MNDIAPPRPPPLLSLCVICGDENAAVLGRMLASVLDRPSGPLVDEVVVQWNGSEACEPDFLVDGLWKAPGGAEVPIVTDRHPWTGDFCAARQRSFEAASGVWRMWLDADDVLSSGDVEEDRVAVDEARGAAVLDGGAPSTMVEETLKEFLGKLPSHINDVWLPYNYVEVQGRAVQRLPRSRIVRWADGWVWHSRVHEDLATSGGNISRPCYLPGLVVRHRPHVAADVRGERNAAILRRLIAEADKAGTAADHRTLYGVAAVAFDARDDDTAKEYLSRALQGSPPAQDRHVYHCLLVQIHVRCGEHDEARTHALQAIAAEPERPGGHLEMARACYFAGDHAGAAIWFRKGFALKERPLATLQTPMIQAGQFRALGAYALASIGALDEALEWARMAVEADPGLLPRRALDSISDAHAAQKVGDAYGVLADHLRLTGQFDCLKALRDACPAVLEGRQAGLAVAAEVLLGREDAGLPAHDPIPPTLAEAAGISGDDPVVGAELCRTFSPGSLLAAAEAGGRPVTVVVPDAWRPKAAAIVDAVAQFTAPRLLRILSRRGRVASMHSLPADPAALGDSRIVARYHPGPPPAGPSVGIWCPHHAHEWGPDDPDLRGTGGSEEAVVHLSRALAERGMRVQVFAPLPAQDMPMRVADGVVWRGLREFSNTLRLDHLVCHRAPWAPAIGDFAADRVWVWHHDHWYGADHWNLKAAGRARHLFVSRWQRSLLEGIVGRRVRGWTIYNGVPPAQYAKARAAIVRKRDPLRAVFASNPTRRLDRLIEMWPDVQAEVPEATLHWYYGMQTAYQLWWRGPVPDLRRKLSDLEDSMRRLRATGRFVVHGRVGQDALTRDLLAAGVLSYPSDFPEVHMIVAARAAAAGMRLVTTDTGCLRETLPDRTYLVEGAASDEAWAAGGRERYLAMLVRALVEPEAAYDREAVAEETLRRFSWARVADRVVEALDADDDTLLDDGAVPPTPREAAGAEVEGIRLPSDPALSYHTKAEAHVRVM